MNFVRFIRVNNLPAAFLLWKQCLGETWTLAETDFVRVLKGNPATHINEYWSAEIGGQIVGFAAAQYGIATDASAGLPLLMVHPDFRRLGIGTALHHKVMERLRETSVLKVQLGAGGAAYFFPGVPDNLTEAIAFFRAQGWTYTETSYDLVNEPTNYATPSGIMERVIEQGITFKHGLPQPPGGDAETVFEFAQRVQQQICEFERREFPECAAYFEKAHPHSLLTAWDFGMQCCWHSADVRARTRN